MKKYIFDTFPQNMLHLDRRLHLHAYMHIFVTA
jgi:hypothetical protein